MIAVFLFLLPFLIMETYDYLNGIEINEENADEVIRQNGLLSFLC